MSRLPVSPTDRSDNRGGFFIAGRSAGKIGPIDLHQGKTGANLRFLPQRRSDPPTNDHFAESCPP